jgi:hypothetical protein
VNEDEIIDLIEKKHKNNFGIICILCLIQKSSYTDLNEFANNNNIKVKRGIQTKVGFLKSIVAHYYNIFENDSILPGNYNNFLEYVGESLLSYKKFRAHLMHFDFISKQELIDVFADYCADLEITVYDTQEIEQYSLDLFLIRRTPLLRTESAVVLTADEMDEANYEKNLKILEESSKIGTWLVFVTTAAGVYKIGLKRFIKDMERLKVWSYVVVPLHMRVYGVTKGKKSKNLNLELRDNYIQKLPREPTRAPSKVVKISNYKFNEGESYKSKNYITFELWTKGELEMAGMMLEEKPKYQKIFRNLLFIDQVSGVSIFSYSSEVQKLDDSLVSGFLQAMDSFVSELGGATSLKEIHYKGFFIQAVYGKLIKIALFLSEPADKILQERLAYLIKKLEENYNTQIEDFRLSGDVSFFYGNEEVITLIKDVLKI